MPATQELLNQGRYRIEQQFGAAGDSTAYSAYDTVGNVNVVVKEIPLKMSKVTTLSQQENIKLAFTNQAQSLKDLRHESILNVEDYFFDVGHQYLVLESVEGENLQAVLNRDHGPIDAGKAAAWADQLLDALEFLGARAVNFVHGKINPRNIYANVDGRVKLVSVGVGNSGEATIDTSVEQAGTESANLCYSPLEQIWDGLDSASQKVISNSYDERSEAILLLPPDARSDAYSLGAVIYHLVTGRKPVDALERSIEMLEGNPDPLAEPLKLNPEIAPEFSSFILKALEVRRENRYDGAAVMRQALKTTLKLIEERTSSESREEEEAANDLKFAVTARQEEVQRLIEAKKQEFEQEKSRQEQILQEKLREAEEQRIAAEKRAAAAEQLLREQQAARDALAAKHAAAVQAENDLLQIAVIDEAAEVPAPRFTAETPINDVSARSVEETAPQIVPVETHFEPLQAEAVAEPIKVEAVEVEPEVEAVRAYSAAETPDYEPYSYQADEHKKPLPVAMIAGVAVALVVLLGGLWAAGLFGSNPPPVKLPQQAVIVPAETPMETEAVISEPQPEPTEQSFVDNTQEDPAAQPTQTVERPVVAATPKPRKPAAEPAKKAEPKKVTVDDLIGDN